MHHKSKHSKNETAIHTEDRGDEAASLASPGAAHRAADGHPRHHRREYRAAAHRHRPAAERLQHQLDDHELLVIFGSLLLFGGRAADLLGRRRMFLTGLTVFTASSFASAMAGSAGALFAARAGQGLGAALLSPAALSIVMAAFQGSQRAKALAAWGAVGGAGAAIGVVVGGVLTEFADWRMIFYVNLPVAAVLLVASLKVVPADTQKPRWRGLDLPGAALATTSLAAIVYGITQADSAGWTSIQTHLCGLGGLAGLMAFAIYELHIDAPLLRVERIADRAVGGGLLLMLLAAGSIFGLFLLCSLYLQGVLGMGPLATGLRLYPARCRRRDRRSPRRSPRSPGTACAAHSPERSWSARSACSFSPASPTNGSYLSDVLPGMLVAGLGLGVAVVTVSVAILTGSRAEEAGMLSGPQLDRPRNRRHARHRHLLDHRRRSERSDPRPARSIGHRTRLPGRRPRRYARQPGGVAVLPRAKHFLPKLRLNPQAMPVH